MPVQMLRYISFAITQTVNLKHTQKKETTALYLYGSTIVGGWFTIPHMHKTNAEELNEASSWGWHAALMTTGFLADRTCQEVHTRGFYEYPKRLDGVNSLTFQSPSTTHQPTLSCPTVGIKVWHAAEGLLKSEHGDISMVCRLQNRGERMARLLILHRVHRKGKVAASMTHHCSSASHMELGARFTYSTVWLLFSSPPSALK